MVRMIVLVHEIVNTKKPNDVTFDEILLEIGHVKVHYLRELSNNSRPNTYIICLLKMYIEA